MNRKSPEQDQKGFSRSRRALLLTGGMMAARLMLPPEIAHAQGNELGTPLVLSPEGMLVLKNGQPVSALPYFASDSMGLHQEIVAKAKENARFEEHAPGVTSESYYAPAGFLKDGITKHGVNKIDHTHFEPGLLEPNRRLRTVTTFEGTAEKVEWDFAVTESGMVMVHDYDPADTTWLRRTQRFGPMTRFDPNKPFTISRLFAGGGTIYVLQIVNDQRPNHFRIPTTQDETVVAQAPNIFKS